MKKSFMVISLALTLCFTVGCQDKEAMAELEEFRAQAELEEENITLIKRFYEAWISGDFEALKEILSPDFVWHTTRDGDLSPEKTLEALKQQMISFPDRKFRTDDLFVKGDKIALRYTFGATHTGDTVGFPATGNKFEITGIAISRVEDGKIVEAWEKVDSLELLLQLGYGLKPPEVKK